MISAWTKHLSSAEEKEKFEKGLRSSRWIIDRLSDMLKQIEENVVNTETSLRTYETPNWDYRQADTNGYRRCLNTIQKLLDLDQKDKNDR